MSDIFENPNVVLVLAVFAGLLVILVVVLFLQNRKIKELKEALRPKFGFLGKPLMAMVVLGGLLGAVFLTYNASLRPTDDPVVRADKDVAIEIKADVEVLGQNDAFIRFAAVPSIDDEEWGIPSDSFDIYWVISGPERIQIAELNKSLGDKSGFTRTLKRGLYEITVEVFHGNRRFEKRQELDLR